MNTDTDKLRFATLSGDGNGFIVLNGRQWRMRFWDSDSLRTLVSDVPAGKAEIFELRDGKFRLGLSIPGFTRAAIERNESFDDLAAAANAADVFEWQTKVLAGFTWYSTREGTWLAVLGDGDTAVVTQFDDGHYHMQRRLSPRDGESYEISASRWESGDSDLRVKTFAEAAAIVVTLPAFLSILGAGSNPA